MEKREQEETEMLVLVAYIPVKVTIDDYWLKPKTTVDNTVLTKQNKIERASV